MKRKLSIFAIGMGMLLMFSKVASGADTVAHITGNDQDALILGTVTQVDDHEIIVEVIKHIVGDNDLRAGSLRRSSEVIRIERNGQTDNFQLGDHVFASLNQNEDETFNVAWGIYLATTEMVLDWEVWRVETGDPIQTAILSDFVNQDGIYTYSVIEGRVIRHQGDANIIIFDPNPPTEIQPRDNEDIDLDEQIQICLEENAEAPENCRYLLRRTGTLADLANVVNLDLENASEEATIIDEPITDLNDDEVLPEDASNTPTLVIATVAISAVAGAILWKNSKKSK